LFTKAIVRTPCKNLINGITTANLGAPNYDLALIQHQGYIEALKKCGLVVIVLDADEDYPDSTFVEDTALLTPECAVITNPGVLSRRGETAGIRKVISNYYSDIAEISEPGTLEAGDVKMVGNHYYIGLSQRTNETGANQLIDILESYGMTGSAIKLEKVLHLKTGVSYLEKNNFVIAGEFITNHEFQKYNQLKIDDDESYAANCVWVNDHVLVAKGFPKTKKLIENAGYNVIEVDVSEFQKLDGGLSCLSLRF
jgi:dimethylargininase